MQRILTKNPSPKEPTITTSAYPFYMIDLSKANWDIYITNKELLSFTEHQLTGKRNLFHTLFPDNPTYAIVICHHMDELYVRFLVDKRWVDEKRCFFSQPVPGTLQKHTDLRLKTYKWELQSKQCLQQQEIKDELDNLRKNSENDKPYKMKDDHPIACAIKAALCAYPDQMSNLFNTSYQEEMIKLYVHEQETTKSNNVAIDALMPALEAILHTESAPVLTIEPPLEKQVPAEQPLEKKPSKTALIEKKSEPQEETVVLPTVKIEPAIILEKSPKKADIDFMLDLKNILAAAEKQHQQAFLRHTGLRNMHAILSSMDENNISRSYLLLKNEATSRSTGLRNWLSNASFFCMSQGRDPAVHALYQSIKKISFDKRNNDGNKLILNNLRQVLNQDQQNTKKLINA